MPDTQPLAEVVCSTAGCGVSFGQYPIGMEPDGQRIACPRCGEYGRTARQTMPASVAPQAALVYEAFPPGPKSRSRRFAWGMAGWQLSVTLQRLVRKASHFDRPANR